MSQEAVSSRATALPAPEYHPDLLPPGTVVGDFRLLRHVATGSYGSVWQVESVERPGRHYALKFSLHRPGEGSVGDARAVREVQLLLRAAHENVVRVVAHGRWRDPDTGPHYVVLQWVEGGTLWQWARDARPSARQVVRLCQKLARALQRAHEAGVLHRDVKPDNVLVRAADGEPFLSDFGVGDARGAHSLTPGAVPPGTPAFHSPQLLASHLPGAAPYRAQPADDWYALGVLLYELLTEVRPYPDEKQAPVLAQWVSRCTPVAPHQLNPRVPPALSQVALTLLSAEPHLRYPHGPALCAALEQALASASEPDAPLLPPAAPPDTAPTQPPTASDGPLAQDEELLTDHAFKEEEDPEELRLEALESRRDALLQSRAQRRPPRALRRAASLARHPWARGVAATVLVGSMALGAWALRPEPSPPALPTPPASALATQTPPPVVASPASPHLAPPGASPPKEGSTVKTPQSPNSSTPTATTSPSRSVVRNASKGALCAAGLAVAGCASVPVRPTQQECPPGANKVMDDQRYDWRKTQLFLKPNTRMGQFVTLKPGPLISVVESDVLGGPPPGSLFRGHVYFAEDGRVVIRYTEAELKGGERVPICFAVVDRDDVTIDLPDDHIKERTEDSVTVHSVQTANRVRVLPD